MYFASSVAVPAAPGKPGIGKGTTGLPPASPNTPGFPAFLPPPRTLVAAVGPHITGAMVPGSADLGGACGLAQMRMSRSCTAAGIAATLPFVPAISAPGVSSFHADCQLTTSMFEYVCLFARVQVY